MSQHAYTELKRIEARQQRMYGSKLTLADLNARIADKVPNSAERSPIPQPTEPFHIGTNMKKPPPDRDMWQMEREHPWLFAFYIASFFLGVFGVAAWQRWFA